jgi:uncharacterized protein (DUF4415 family)
MKKSSTAPAPHDLPPLTRADIEQGKLVLRKRAADGRVLPGKERVNIFLDRAIIEYFRAKAGARGYQTLINDALREVVRGEDLVKLIRRTIRDALRAR